MENSSMTDTAKKVENLLVDKFLSNGNTITPESRLEEDMGLSSLDTWELVIELEEEFSIDIPNDQIDTWSNVSDIITTIDAVLVEKAA